MVSKKRSITGIMLLMVYAFFFASTTLFVHTHIISDVKIVHSHPFNGASPSHDLNQFNLVGTLDSAVYEESEVPVAPTPVPTLFHKAAEVTIVAKLHQPHILTFSLRAPPYAYC